MRTAELVRFAAGGLWRQKVRTTLTLVGVTVGTTALVFSLALGLGLRAFIDREFTGRADFWRVGVAVSDPSPDAETLSPEQKKRVDVPEPMSDDRRRRLREALLDRAFADGVREPKTLITPDKIAEIAALPDVEEVRTYRTAGGRVWIGDQRSWDGMVLAGRLTDLDRRLVAGRLPASDEADEVLVSELALYERGVRSDADVAAFLGSTVRVEVGNIFAAPPAALAGALGGRLPKEGLTPGQYAVLQKLSAALPARLDALGLAPDEVAELKRLLDRKKDPGEELRRDAGGTATGTFRVVGVVRVITREDRKREDPTASHADMLPGDVFLPAAAGERLFRQLPWARRLGFLAAEVRVRHGGDLAGAVAAIEGMGFRTVSALKWFGQAKREVTLIAAGLNLFSLIALFVAGVGITNTLVTSVVERTREIGILKAVGATRGQVLGLFLLEGTMIGLVGSGLGLGLGRLLAVPADRWVHGYIEKQISGEKLVSTSVFEFPWWLWAGAVAFAVVVTTAAAFYPARRAARVDPIQALKYE